MNIHKSYQLKPKNTFGIAAEAGVFLELNAVKDVQMALDYANQQGDAISILGGGSNILFTQDPKSIILHPTFKSYKQLDEDNYSVFVEVEAGMNWHQWVLTCLEKGWYGLENLSLIPGLVGAAPIQNIGAYGVEVKNHIVAVNYIALEDGVSRTLKAEECQFGYRDSLFKRDLKGKIIITSVVFKLRKSAVLNTSYGAIETELQLMGIKNPGPRDVSMAVISIRESKLPNPKVLGNGGSFFKNPVLEKAEAQGLINAFPGIPQYSAGGTKVKIAAGWLIENASWKGKRIGNCGVHDKQALVLVNYGNATGNEIKDLAYKVIDSVKQKFGITLEPEVNIW